MKTLNKIFKNTKRDVIEQVLNNIAENENIDLESNNDFTRDTFRKLFAPIIVYSKFKAKKHKINIKNYNKAVREFGYEIKEVDCIETVNSLDKINDLINIWLILSDIKFDLEKLTRTKYTNIKLNKDTIKLIVNNINKHKIFGKEKAV